MVKFRDPKQTLLATVEKFGRERPVSRYVSLYNVAQRLPLSSSLAQYRMTERFGPLNGTGNMHLVHRACSEPE